KKILPMATQEYQIDFELIQELIEDGIYAVTRYRPEGDNLMRLHAQTGTIENGFVYLPHEAHWLPDYLHELTTFPGQSTTIKLTRPRKRLPRTPGWGIREYYRRQADALPVPARLPTVKVKPATLTSHVYIMSGQQFMAAADGTFELPEEDAKRLLAAGWQPAA